MRKCPIRVDIGLSDAFSYNICRQNLTESPHPMIIGYARTSTTGQTAGLAGQERDLAAAGATKLFTEQVSSVANAPN